MVRDGVLVRTSVSNIESFDSSTAFGCERRWYFKDVLGLEEPAPPGTGTGKDVHKVFEFAAKREAGEFDPRAMSIAFPGLPYLEQFRTEGIVGIEHFFETQLAGVPLIGYIDLLTNVRVQDWKTSSDPEKYGKTEGDLRKSTQMLVYAHVTGKRLVSHVTLATKGKPRATLTEAKLSEEGLASGIKSVIVTVERMKQAASLKSVKDLPPDESKCNRCPFAVRCPRGNTLMGLLDAFMKPSTPAPAPQAPAAPQVAQVKPPDAPVSVATSPAASKPVEALPTDSPEVRRRIQIRDVPADGEEASVTTDPRPAASPAPVTTEVPARKGRPPGAKNKPKPLPEGAAPGTADPSEVRKALGNVKPEVVAEPFEAVPPPLRAHDAPKAEKKEREETFALRVHTIRVTRGGTVNLGNYNSMRIEYSAEAEVAGSVEDAYKALLGHVDLMLKKELEALPAKPSVETQK